MKQYQIKYENRESLNKWLSDIKNICRTELFSDMFFYLTWTKSAQAEIKNVTEAIEFYFPDLFYYGNESSGNISMGNFTYGINITCFAFEDNNTKTELVWVEKGTALSNLSDLWAYCREKENLRGIELIPSIFYLDFLKIDRNVPDIDPGILIFGGASINYDDASYGADIIAKGHPVTREGMAVVLYYGTELTLHSCDILGWKGLGKQMEVTDSTGKTIRKIDNVPAYSVYEKYLNLTVEDKDTLVFPLIAEEEGYEFIRTPQIIRPDKSMLMFADIPAGTHVRISYGDKNTILKSLAEKAEEIDAFKPDTIKAYSCAARRLFWGDNEVGRETLIFQNIAPVCGFYTGGEILRFGNKLRVLNQTLALVSFGEGKKAEKNPDKSLKLEKSRDKSLLSRLTYFAEKIVEEEKAQRVLSEGFESVFKSQYQIMYFIDLVKGGATFLYGDEDAKKFLPIFNTESAEIMFENFHKYYVDAAVVPEDRDRVKNIMNAANIYRALKTQNSISVNFRVRRNYVDPVYTEMRIIKAAEENGTITAAILAFKLTDEELRTALETQKVMEENARIIGALSEDFSCVDYVEITFNKENDVCTEVRTSDFLKHILPEWEKTHLFSKKLDLLLDNLIYKDDREEFYQATRREKIIDELNISNAYFINVRMFIEEEIRYYQVKISAVRENGVLVGFVVGTRSVDKRTKKDLETQKQLKEALKMADEESFRNALLYKVVSAQSWSYKISADDKVVGSFYSEGVYSFTNAVSTGRTMGWIDIVHPEDRERVMKDFMAAIYDHSGNTEYDSTFRVIYSDGSILWCRSAGKVMRHSDGTGEFFGMIFDITAQMEEQQKHLLGAIPLSSDVLSKANIGLWSFELDEGQPPRMYVDDTMLGLLGLDHQVAPEETYHAWYDNIDTGSYDLVTDAVAKMSSGEHAEVQYPWHHPNGHTLMVRCGGVRNPEYTKGIRIEGTHQDVTQTLHYDEEERKRAKQIENDLIISKLRADSLAYIADNEPDLDNAIHFFGKRILEISGCDQVVFRDLSGHRIVLNASGISDVSLNVCSECPFADFDNEIFSKEGYIIISNSAEGIQGIKPHKKCPVKSSFMQHIHSGGELAGLLSMHYMKNKHSFSESEIGIMKIVAFYLGVLIGRIKEKQSEIARIKAESSNKAKTEFLFNMSHDIRTPMNAILGYTDIATHHIGENDKVSDSLKKIKMAGGHLLNLINDILEMSRIEAGKLDLITAPMDIRRAINVVDHMSQALAIPKSISFKAVTGNIENPYIYADELHVNQILINLISNAVKYTPVGGDVEYYAEQISEPSDGFARYRFTIKDNGIGMSEEFQAHLFENFSRENTATVSKQEGAGLGLSIVKKITDLSGGTVSVQSKKGEGSTFVVEIPFRVLNEAEIEQYESTQVDKLVIDQNGVFRGKKVLLVEDNELNREIAVEILSENGLVTETAEDGAIAVKRIEEKGMNYYDFILMDIQMPVMNGYEATASIRKMPDGSRVPIIALSANAFEEDKRKSLEAGMNAHVAKPINVKELFVVLSKFI